MRSVELVLTHDEIRALVNYMTTQSRARTYRLLRDTANVLSVCNPDGRLYRLTPRQ